MVRQRGHVSRSHLPIELINDGLAGPVQPHDPHHFPPIEVVHSLSITRATNDHSG
jgi:hypothetical protein